MNKFMFGGLLASLAALSESSKKAAKSFDKFSASKHQGSNSNYRPISRKVAKRLHNEKMTNHQRVVLARADRMGLTVSEYQSKFPKGYQS